MLLALYRLLREGLVKYEISFSNTSKEGEQLVQNKFILFD